MTNENKQPAEQDPLKFRSEGTIDWLALIAQNLWVCDNALRECDNRGRIKKGSIETAYESLRNIRSELLPLHDAEFKTHMKTLDRMKLSKDNVEYWYDLRDKTRFLRNALIFLMCRNGLYLTQTVAEVDERANNPENHSE